MGTFLCAVVIHQVRTVVVLVEKTTVSNTNSLIIRSMTIIAVVLRIGIMLYFFLTRSIAAFDFKLIYVQQIQ